MNRIALLFVFAVLSASAQTADNQPAGKQYRLDFVVKETGGNEPIPAKTYTTLISTAPHENGCQIRAGGRIPIPTCSLTTDGKSTTQYQEVNVGTNIDCRNASDTSAGLRVLITAEVSSVYKDPVLPAPVIRQNNWNATVTLPLRKPTLLFSSDDPSSKRRVTVELTATPDPAGAEK